VAISCREVSISRWPAQASACNASGCAQLAAELACSRSLYVASRCEGPRRYVWRSAGCLGSEARQVMARFGSTSDVSAVIPTLGRQSLRIAVRSVINQDLLPRELVIVFDLAEVPPDVTDWLAFETNSTAVKILAVTTGGGAGGGAARNLGVAVASSELVAFLDDDDEWLPTKLSQQAPMLRDAMSSGRTAVFSASSLVAKEGSQSFVWPRFEPIEGADIGEYLYARRSNFQGDGVLQTSTLMIPRAFIRKCQFREDLPRHQDDDWVIRAVARHGAKLVFVPDPLSIYTIGTRSSVSSGIGDLGPSLRWIRDVRPLISRQAYGNFLLTYVIQRVRFRDLAQVPGIYIRALFWGRPSIRALAGSFVMLLTTHRQRMRLRGALSVQRVHKKRSR
jgi:glycosyltransferase involved in cell wall biosynthesis